MHSDVHIVLKFNNQMLNTACHTFVYQFFNFFPFLIFDLNQNRKQKCSKLPQVNCARQKTNLICYNLIHFYFSFFNVSTVDMFSRYIYKKKKKMFCYRFPIQNHFPYTCLWLLLLKWQNNVAKCIQTWIQ